MSVTPIHSRRPPLALVEPSGAPEPPRAIVPRTGVLVADGQALVRAGLRALLDAESDIAVLGEAADAAEARALIRRERPAVVLLDAALPGLGGVRGAARMVADPAHVGVHFVLVLSQAESDAELLDALRAGAGSLLVKDARPWQLIDAVRAVASGGGVLSPSVARRLIDEFAALPDRTRPTPGGLAELTRREVEVVALVACGMSNRDIARHLVISPATAKTHVSRALGKLALRDRAQLVTLAYETGLVVPRTSPNAA